MMGFFKINFWERDKKVGKETTKSSDSILKTDSSSQENKLNLDPLDYKNVNFFLNNHLKDIQVSNKIVESNNFLIMNFASQNKELNFYLPQTFECKTTQYNGYYMNFTRLRNFFDSIRRLRQD